MKSGNQESLKQSVKLWLKENGRSYAWLAENCCVSETTVRNWMRSKPIPKVKEQLLRQIISRNPSRISHPVSVNIETIITLRIDSTTHQNLQTKARLLGLTLESYLVKAMMHIIDT